MKFTKSEVYIRLLERALEDTLIPELKSGNALQTAQLMKNTLTALLGRETRTPGILAKGIATGSALLAEMQGLLPVPETHAVQVLASSIELPLLTLIDRHGKITHEIAESAKRLVDQIDIIGVTRVMDVLGRVAEWEGGQHAQESAPLAGGPAENLVRASFDPLPIEQFERYLQSVLTEGDAVKVTSLARVPGGFGKQTFLVTTVIGDEREQELVVRMNDGLPMFEFESFHLDREFELVKRLHELGYRAPRALCYGRDVVGVAQDFYVMEKLPGTMAGTFLGGAASLSETFLRAWAQVIAQLHTLPIEAFSDFIEEYDDPSLLRGTQCMAYVSQLGKWRTYLDAQAHLASPYLTYMLAWLERHIPDSDRAPSIVHGDFYIHNILAVGDRVTGVLDWETAMIGAPEQDLAYIKPSVEKHMGWREFIAHYMAAGGREPDEASFPFYTAFAGFRIAVGGNRGILNLQSGKYNDIRFTLIERGFMPAFMQMGLGSTRAACSPLDI